MKTAIVHDWLNGMRGGEKVLDALVEQFPDATLFTLFREAGKVSRRIAERPTVTSWLDRLPGVYRHYRSFLPLFPAAIESLDLRGFDLVLSSSHAVAKSVRTHGAVHICYCHTPMRYLWDERSGYTMKVHQRVALAVIRGWMQRWDKRTSARVDQFIANSEFVRQRIARYYAREATVIHPPVDTEFFRPAVGKPRQDFYLTGGALVSYKRFDLVVEAFSRLRKRLVVVGTGPDETSLRRSAGPNVEFLGSASDGHLRRLYQEAVAFVFPAREDFGMMPVEAMACGCAVVALGEGGALETVREGINGTFFQEASVEAIVSAVERFEKTVWNSELIRSTAERFCKARFVADLNAEVHRCMKRHNEPESPRAKL